MIKGMLLAVITEGVIIAIITAAGTIFTTIITLISVWIYRALKIQREETRLQSEDFGRKLKEERDNCIKDKEDLQLQIDELKTRVIKSELDLFGNSTIPRWIKDMDGKVLAVNRAFMMQIASRYGLMEARIIGMHFEDIFPYIAKTSHKMDIEARTGYSVRPHIRFAEEDTITYRVFSEIQPMKSDIVYSSLAVPENQMSQTRQTI